MTVASAGPGRPARVVQTGGDMHASAFAIRVRAAHRPARSSRAPVLSGFVAMRTFVAAALMTAGAVGLCPYDSAPRAAADLHARHG